MNESKLMLKKHLLNKTKLWNFRELIVLHLCKFVSFPIEIAMIKVTAGHLSVDLNHTSYRIIWENLSSNATIDLRVRVRRGTDELGNYLDYSELEGMHLALADARVQIQQLIGWRLRRCFD